MATFDQRFPDSDWTMGGLAAQDDYEMPQVDPLTGAVINPSPAAQAKFGRIMDAVGSGLRNWIETPGRAYQEGLTPEEEADWGAGTAFGMLGANAPAAMTGAIPRGAVGIAGGRPLGGKIGGPHEGGIYTYHSSPYDFENFDWSKLRTGRGRQHGRRRLLQRRKPGRERAGRAVLEAISESVRRRRKARGATAGRSMCIR